MWDFFTDSTFFTRAFLLFSLLYGLESTPKQNNHPDGCSKACCQVDKGKAVRISIDEHWSADVVEVHKHAPDWDSVLQKPGTVDMQKLKEVAGATAAWQHAQAKVAGAPYSWLKQGDGGLEVAPHPYHGTLLMRRVDAIHEAKVRCVYSPCGVLLYGGN